jgi:hypothetical protein
MWRSFSRGPLGRPYAFRSMRFWLVRVEGSWWPSLLKRSCSRSLGGKVVALVGTGFPVWTRTGFANCNSVILGSNMGYRGFRLKRYDLATGSVDTLPPHPLVKRGNYYADSVEDMKLSLRDLLAPAPQEQTSKGWRLVQGRWHYKRRHLQRCIKWSCKLSVSCTYGFAKKSLLPEVKN